MVLLIIKEMDQALKVPTMSEKPFIFGFSFLGIQGEVMDPIHFFYIVTFDYRVYQSTC